MAAPALIYCADGNPAFARAAVEAGWLYGARLPAKVYEEVYFADQDWKEPNRMTYMRALERHRPAMATVLDLERPDQLSEVLSWAEEAAAHVTRAVVVIPKVPGIVADLPREVGGKPVVLGYSVPTRYGGTPCPIWEFRDWPVHLLGGSPQAQLRLAGYLPRLVSADGNMAHQQAHRCRFWAPRHRDYDDRWVPLSKAGDNRREGANLECFRRSLAAIREAWLSTNHR